MDQKQPMGLTSAMQLFFGRLPNQNLSEFAAEVKKLTDEDKAEIKAGLEKNGYIIKA